MTDDEQQLRDLLERAVPQLPAPAQRLERIRERVGRRRRARTVGLSATVLAAVAIAGLMVPGTPPQGAGGPRTRATTVTAATARPATTSPYPLTRFQAPALTLRLPPGWHSRAVKTAVYASTQTLSFSPVSCENPLGESCTPLARRLPRHGVLMTLRMQYGRRIAGKGSRDRTLTWAPVSKQCWIAGGTEELYALVTDPQNLGQDTAATVRMCLAYPEAAQEAAVRDVLKTVEFT